MSFHKRYLTKEIILNNLHRIDDLLKADALMTDNWSNRFIKDLDPEDRSLRTKIKEDNKLISGCPDKHSDYSKLKSLSETLISLNSGADWLDIHFTQDKLGRFKLNDDEYGVIDVLKEKAINAIISHYES